MSSDPKILVRPEPPDRAPARAAVAQSAPDLCGWCYGAGRYLEALDCDTDHVYLPVVCSACGGSGRRGDG